LLPGKIVPKHITVMTTNEVAKLKLSTLLRRGFIQKGAFVKGVFSWTDGSEIDIESTYTKWEQFIRLSYTVTDLHENNYRYDYVIPLTFVSSNIGRGQVPYFVCPDIGKRCRILYRAFDSKKWKCREAYKQTIFYQSQMVSKYNKYNDEYWKLEKQIKNLREQARNQSHYKGRITRRYKRLERLREKQRRADYLRWQPENLPKSLNEFINKISF